MCYDSGRYEWARRAARMQAEMDRAEARKAEGKRQKEKGRETEPEGALAWFKLPASLFAFFR